MTRLPTWRADLVDALACRVVASPGRAPMIQRDDVHGAAMDDIAPGPALPHLVPLCNAEISASILDELKALRSDVQPMLKAANEGVGEIARLQALLAEREADIPAAAALLRAHGWRVQKPIAVCGNCGGEPSRKKTCAICLGTGTKP